MQHPLRSWSARSGLRAALQIGLGLGIFGAACGGDKNNALPPTQPARFCPGQENCPKGGDQGLLAGAAAIAITPSNFERPLPEYLEFGAGDGRCNLGEPCGELLPVALKDCGKDMLCRGDPNYLGPDADGSEKDGVFDFFRDCGVDKLCPGDPNYTSPDADGSEGNGIFDGLWLAGFGNNRPATGVHDDIWSRAVVLSQGETTVAIAYVDLVGVFHNHVLKVRESIRTRRPEVFAKLDYIFVGATHVHEAPDSLGQWGMALPPGIPGLGLPEAYRSGVNHSWFDQAIVQIADSIIAAYDTKQAAKAAVASQRTGAKGLIRDSRDPRIVDDTLSVMTLDALSDGSPIATLVNWGNHPEVLASSNNLVTSDFIDPLRVAVEQGLPAEGNASAVAGRGGVCVYLQSSVGGLLTPLGSIGAATRDGTPQDKADWEKNRAVGERVAEKALAIAKITTPLDNPQLSFASENMLLPMDNIFFQVLFGVNVFDRVAYEADGSPWNGGLIDPDTHVPHLKTESLLMRLGDVAFLSVPGELFSELAVGLDATWTPPGVERIQPTNPNPPTLPSEAVIGYRDRLQASQTFILGLGMDEVGYLVPPWQFELDPTSPYYDRAAGDHYEETNSLGPKTVPTLESHLEILFSWPGEP